MQRSDDIKISNAELKGGGVSYQNDEPRADSEEDGVYSGRDSGHSGGGGGGEGRGGEEGTKRNGKREKGEPRTTHSAVERKTRRRRRTAKRASLSIYIYILHVYMNASKGMTNCHTQAKASKRIENKDMSADNEFEQQYRADGPGREPDARAHRNSMRGGVTHLLRKQCVHH